MSLRLMNPLLHTRRNFLGQIAADPGSIALASQFWRGRRHFAGVGVQAETPFGLSDDWSWKAVEGGTASRDFQATILHLLGIDRSLTDVPGRVLEEILS